MTALVLLITLLSAFTLFSFAADQGNTQKQTVIREIDRLNNGVVDPAAPKARIIIEYEKTDQEILEKYAEIEKEMFQTDYHSRVEGSVVIIDMREATGLARKYEFGKTKKTQDDAVDFLFMRTILYHEAEQKGLLASEEDIQAEIQFNKSVKLEDFVQKELEGYCELLGMTTDEFWDAQYSAYFYGRTLANYEEYLCQQLLKADSTLTEEEQRKLGLEHYEKLKAQYSIRLE